VFGEFVLLELCRLNLFKFRIKILKIKRKLNSPPLGPSIFTPGAEDNGSGGQHRPLAGGHGQRRYHATVADRWDRAIAGPGGQRWGAGQARQRDAALTRDPVA
jgi:hypothetical protein